MDILSSLSLYHYGISAGAVGEHLPDFLKKIIHLHDLGPQPQ